MPLDLSLAKDILFDFVQNKSDLDALKGRFQKERSKYYESAIDIGRKIQLKRKSVEELSKQNSGTDDCDYQIRCEKPRLLPLEKLHMEDIPQLIKSFEDFFEGIDKIFQMEATDLDTDQLVGEVEKATENLFNAEKILQANSLNGLTGFHGIFFDIFDIFAPLDSNVHTQALDHIVRPQKALSTLSNRTFDVHRNIQVKGLYYRQTKIVALALAAYLNGMKTDTHGMDYSQVELRSLLKTFESMQKNLFPSLKKADAQNYKEVLGVDKSHLDLSLIMANDSVANAYQSELLEQLVGSDFADAKAKIRELLVVDAYSSYQDLYEELGEEPGFDDYARVIDEKTNPEAANIRRNLSADINALIDNFSYGSSPDLNAAYISIAHNSGYGLRKEFKQEVMRDLEEVLAEISQDGTRFWLNGTVQSPLYNFLKKASREIFSKIDTKFYKKYDKDVTSALRTSFENYNIKALKQQLRDINQFAKHAGVDKKELLKFTYIISRAYQRFANVNGKDSLGSRVKRIFRKL